MCSGSFFRPFGIPIAPPTPIDFHVGGPGGPPTDAAGEGVACTVRRGPPWGKHLVYVFIFVGVLVLLYLYFKKFGRMLGFIWLVFGSFWWSGGSPTDAAGEGVAGSVRWGPHGETYDAFPLI
jgi:hypothetical protein